MTFRQDQTVISLSSPRGLTPSLACTFGFQRLMLPSPARVENKWASGSATRSRTPSGSGPLDGG